MTDCLIIETEDSGAGTISAGVGPSGLYVPATVAASPGVSAGSRFIDPKTRDYQIDSDTEQTAQMPPTRQRVLLALMTVKGSATANPEFGMTIPDKIRPTFVTEMTFSARDALSHLTREDAPVISIDGITVGVPSPGRSVLTVSYIDLLTGESDEATVSVI